MSIEPEILHRFGKPFIVATVQDTVADALRMIAAHDLKLADAFLVVIGDRQHLRVVSFKMLEDYLEEKGYDALSYALKDLPYLPDEVIQLDTVESGDDVLDRLRDAPNNVFLILQGEEVAGVLNVSALGDYGNVLALIGLFLDHLKAKDHPFLDKAIFSKAVTVVTCPVCGCRDVVRYDFDAKVFRCRQCGEVVTL